MKTKAFTRIIAIILSVIMVVSPLTYSVFATGGSNIVYIDGGAEDVASYEHLGRGFNALSDTQLYDTSLTKSVIINFDKVRAFYNKTSRSNADVKYSTTARNLMLEFGIDYSNKIDVGLPLKNAKVGFSQKFGLSTDLKYEKIAESLYYYYREDHVKGKYGFEFSYDDLREPSNIINDDFKSALNDLNNNYSDENCAEFFNTWGTHILVSYLKGAAIEYVAVAHSKEEEISIDNEIKEEMNASATKDLVQAEGVLDLAADLSLVAEKDKFYLSHRWFTIGGKSELIKAHGTDASKVSEDNITEWKNSLSDRDEDGKLKNPLVMIPQSTEWISIWELIPNTYATAKNRLQTYYKTNAEGLNAAFFSKFTNYSEVGGATHIWYTSPTGYISQISYYTNGSTKVAPGSTFKIVSSDADLSNIVFVPEGDCTVDKYGTVTIGENASGKVTVRVTDLEGKEISGATKTFTVEKEGIGLYEGGYGDPERPYLIANATQFSNIRNYPDQNFVLTKDISLGNIPPIPEFKGKFDGAERTLKNWTYSSTNSDNVGLFETIGADSIVKNFEVYNPRVVATDVTNGTLNMGVICGTNNGRIENVQVNGKDTIYTNDAYTLNGKVGSIDREADSHAYIGGICGTNKGIIQRCGVKNCVFSGYSGSGRNDGTANTWIGGIAGLTESGSEIYDCFSHTNDIVGSAEGKTWYSWGKKGANGKINLGGVVGCSYGLGAIKRVLGYDIVTVCDKLEGKDTYYYEGSLIGYVSIIPPTMENCYGESTDTLIGNRSVSGAYTVESLTAAGVINNLNGFAAKYWIQSSSGGDLYFARDLDLDIRGMKTEYFVGEPFSLEGATIEAVKNDAAETRTDVTGGIQVKGYNPNKAGDQIILIDTPGIAYAFYSVTVSEPKVTDIVISSTPYKTTYFKPFEKTGFAGENLDFTGLSVIAQYNDGTSAEVPVESLTLPKSDIVTESGDIKVSYGGYSKSYRVEAVDICPNSISVVEGSYNKNYALGDSFDATGIKAVLTYNNGDKITLDAEYLTIDSTGFMQNGAGTYRITVGYDGIETSFDVIVGSVKSISIEKKPNKVNYYSCEKNLDTTGLSLNVTYDNGVTKVISSGFTTSGYNHTAIGKQDITVSYDQATTTFQITVIAQHIYTEKTVAPSCSKPGYTMYTCAKCSHSYTEAIAATGHTEVMDQAIAATCTTEGKTEGSRCSVCNAVIKAQETVPALGHDYTGVITDPTCTKQGYTTHACSRCTDSYKDSYTDATGHGYRYTDKGDTHEAVCTQCSHSMIEAHSYTDNTCVCGAVEVLAPIMDSSIVINHSLNLASDISINYAVKTSLLSGYDSFYLEVQVPIYRENALTGFKTLTIEPVLNGGYYYFTMVELTAMNMNDILVATLHMNKGKQEYLSRPDSYSVATYAQSILNQSGMTESLKVLCADLLRYGAAAQIYKNYRTDALATMNMTDAHRTYFSDLNAVTFGSVNKTYNDLTDPMITWAGKAMNLGSKVVVKFVFNAGIFTGDVSKLTLRMIYQGTNGVYRNITLSNPTVYNEEKRMYAFEFDGLMAAELRTALSVAVYNGDTQLSQTMQYSADTYGNSASGTLLELCKALFAYSDSAKAYFVS